MGPKKSQAKKGKPGNNKRTSANKMATPPLSAGSLPLAQGPAAKTAEKAIIRGGFNVSVRQHESKGRVLVSTKAAKPGQILFSEPAAVHGSWHEHWCLECDAEHSPDTCEVVR